MMRWIWLAAGVIIAAIAAAGIYFVLDAQTIADDRAMRLPIDPAPLIAETGSGERSFIIEVADDFSERSRGLMFRETMDDDHGMLFVFEQTQDVGFWMKDTPMPLDLVFIGQDGRVRGVLPGEPFSQAVISPGEPARFVLELKRGTAEKAGIKKGDLIRHPAIGGAAGPGNAG